MKLKYLIIIASIILIGLSLLIQDAVEEKPIIKPITMPMPTPEIKNEKAKAMIASGKVKLEDCVKCHKGYK